MKKDLLFANLKKWRFHQDEVQFFDYIKFLYGICIKDEQMESIYNLPML